MNNGWIGVDLDGTLAYYDEWRGIEHVGKPIRPMCDRVRKWLKEGQNVKIFTARVTALNKENADEILGPIHEFCKREFGQILPVTNVKDFGMVELWDDRAISIVPNTGKIR